MMTPMEHPPLAPTTKTGFGFEEIMRNPDYSRFMQLVCPVQLLRPRPPGQHRHGGGAGGASESRCRRRSGRGRLTE